MAEATPIEATMTREAHDVQRCATLVETLMTRLNVRERLKGEMAIVALNAELAAASATSDRLQKIVSKQQTPISCSIAASLAHSLNQRSDSDHDDDNDGGDGDGGDGDKREFGVCAPLVRRPQSQQLLDGFECKRTAR